uniref:Uncharacterized protein n=1 Tax=Setaria viridis TaxID=4556 RepID=A0A4U6TVQ1_SETVI|nr:hypothetical protein SEVIR_7G190250v2 [Setaria viridis]
MCVFPHLIFLIPLGFKNFTDAQINLNTESEKRLVSFIQKKKQHCLHVFEVLTQVEAW